MSPWISAVVITLAAFLATVGRQAPGDVEHRECQHNGQPAIVTYRGSPRDHCCPHLDEERKIHRIFIQADAAQLQRVCGIN